MDYLQYNYEKTNKLETMGSFKPCYKWITFNTLTRDIANQVYTEVLNLVINGLPSILPKDYIVAGIKLSKF